MKEDSDVRLIRLKPNERDNNTMEKYTIDTAMLRLKEITESLEKNEFDLEMSMKLYEEGVHLVSFCNNTLTNAKQRIIELSQLADGEVEDE